MTTEIELKLELDPADVSSVTRHVEADGEPQSSEQLSVYYDTSAGKLRKQGFSLRVRSSPDGFIQTVKTTEFGAGLFFRGEWETPVDSIDPHVEELKRTPAGAAGAKKLRPTVRSEVRRTTWQSSTDASVLEFALDTGMLQVDGRKTPVCEIEIELLKGEAAEAFRAARALAEKIPVRIGVLSKAERGFALADGALAKATKAPVVPVQPEMDVAAGFATIALSCLRHFRLNEPLVVEGRDPVALHQARVAMRRLRSALSLFRPALIDGELEAMREELRWFTGQLGVARNLDVILERELPEQVRDTLQHERGQAYEHVISALHTKRVRLLMIDLVRWVSLGGWRRNEKAMQPLPAFGSRRIERLWQRIAAHEDLRRMGEEARHDVRIEVKKLRYGLEFLQALHAKAGRKQKRFLNALEALQESLGELNDIATARQMDLLGVPNAIDPAEEPALIAKAQRRFKRLKKLGPFWID